MARTAAKLFGGCFTLPVTLAILCCKRRDEDLWRHGVDEAAVEAVLTEFPNTFKLPESWKKDKTITGHVISTRNYSDTKQMTRLMRAMVNRSKGKKNAHDQDDESGDEESEYGEAPEDEPEEAGSEVVEPEEMKCEEGEPVDAQADGAAEEAKRAMIDLEVDHGAQESTQEERMKDALPEKASRSGKIRGGASKIPLIKAKKKGIPQKMAIAGKESDSKSAASAVWYVKRSLSRLT